MANNGGNDRRDGEEDPIARAMHCLLLELEWRFDAKLINLLGK